MHSIKNKLGNSFAIRDNALATTQSYLTNNREFVYVNQRYFSQQAPNQQNDAKTGTYKDDFEKMKKEQEQKDSKEQKDKQHKESTFENLSNLKQNVFVNLKFGKDVQPDPLHDQLKEEKLRQEAEGAKDNIDQSATQEEKVDEQTEKVAPESEMETEKKKINEEPTKQPSFMNKVVDYLKETMDETFPSDRYEKKKKIKQAQAKLQKKIETIEFTEEELEKVFRHLRLTL